ncbi:MAG: DUF4830 domain-containing protein [Ruminococcaceae bacterium]|nr:DUF4830 domain-containing protein [Oscillospiraceae bacterium]
MCFLFTLTPFSEGEKISRSKSGSISLNKKKENKTHEIKKKNRKRLLIVLSVCLGVLVLFALWCVYRINYVPSVAYCEGAGEYSLKAESEAQRLEFFSELGLKAKKVYEDSVIIPTGGEVFECYNAMQMSQGLDLKPYRGETAKRYIFRLTESSEVRSLYAVMLVYKGRVVAVHTTAFYVGEDAKPLLS